jgi:arylsulfatase A-like enzyme
MSGKPAYEHGVMSNRWVDGAVEPATSLSGRLGAAGYQTRLIGKTHFGPTGHYQGFDHIEEFDDWRTWLAEHHPQAGGGRGHGLGGNENSPHIEPLPLALNQNTWLVNRSLDFMRSRDPSRPFMLWLSFLHPHPPYTPSQEQWLTHQDLDPAPRVTGDWSTKPEEIPAAFQAVTRELSMTQRFSDQRLASIRRAYQATLGDVDYQLGRLFGALTEQGMLENTWIIFTSDHGEMLGDHYLGGKCVPFEASVGVPLIVRPPHAPRDSNHAWRGSVRDDLITLADIAPTLCNIAGADADGMTGIDWSRSLTQPETPAPTRERVFYSCMYLHGVRDNRYKVVKETLDGTTLAFDLHEDPEEQHNLWPQRETNVHLQELAAALDDHLDQLAERHGDLTSRDPGVISSTDFVPQDTHPGYQSK